MEHWTPKLQKSTGRAPCQTMTQPALKLLNVHCVNRISLAKRAVNKHGWETITYHCRGVEVTRQYKTFLATSELISGVIRVVILRFDEGDWAAYFRTDSEVSVRAVLETIAARWSVEEHSHDVKEVWGA